MTANGSVAQKITKDTTSQATLETITYEYNLQNRLRKQTVRDGSDTVLSWTKFTYNDDGIRVKKEHFDGVDTAVTTYLIDPYNHTGYAQVLEEWDTTSTPALIKTYTIGDDIITQYSTTPGAEHFLYDGHGSTRQLIDSSQIITHAYSYDAYGMMLGTDDTAADNAGTSLLYAGEQYDSDLSQYYLRARYYNPYSGTFNRADPFAGNNQDPQSLHKYLYCHANPINNIDPSGTSILGTFVSAVINFVQMHLAMVICFTVAVALGGLYIWANRRDRTPQGPQNLRDIYISEEDFIDLIQGWQNAMDNLDEAMNWINPETNTVPTNELQWNTALYAVGLYPQGDNLAGFTDPDATAAQAAYGNYFESPQWYATHPLLYDIAQREVRPEKGHYNQKRASIEMIAGLFRIHEAIQDGSRRGFESPRFRAIEHWKPQTQEPVLPIHFVLEVGESIPYR